MGASPFLSMPGMILLGAAQVGAAADSAIVSRLCEHVTARKVLIVDRSAPEIVWSDGAMIEIARSFPRELETLLASPTATRDLRPALARMTEDKPPGWQDARVVQSGSGAAFAIIESADGALTLNVASPYFAYLRLRYPRATIRVKTRYDPVLFVDDGTLRASVMPMAMGDAPR